MTEHKKKILFVITKSNWGGAQKHVFDLASSLPKDRFEAVVAMGGEGILKEKLDAAGIRTVGIASMERDMDLAKELRSFAALRKIIRSERPDALHLHSPKAGGLGALAGRLEGVRNIVYTAHGWTWNEERPFWQKALIWKFSWITSLLTHKTVTLSPAEHDQGRTFPFAGKSMELIPLGLSRPAFFDKETSRKFFSDKGGLTIGPATFVAGTIAELHRNKAYEAALLGFADFHKDFPDSIFISMGEGEERGKLEALVKELGLTGKIALLGHVDGAARYLTGLDAFILPSRKEGLPYTILEAGLASVPVAASDVGGIPSVISHMENGLLMKKADAGAVAHALTYFHNHPTEAGTMAEALRRKVSEDFSSGTMMAKLIALYLR